MYISSALSLEKSKNMYELAIKIYDKVTKAPDSK